MLLKTFSLFITLLLVLSTVLAQQISLPGRVSIHNSVYRTGQIEYVSDTYLSAAFATATQSDAVGQFELVFTGLANGEMVEVTAEKDQLEVVNEYDLYRVVLGRTTPLKVFLAPKGELAKAQTALYEVSLAAITARYDQLIRKLRRADEQSNEIIATLGQQLNREIANRFEAEEALYKQLEAIKKRLPESSKQLALVNLDFASEQYRKAYEWYKAGEVEKAIAALKEGELENATERISTELNSIASDRGAYAEALAREEENVAQIVQTYELKAEAYSLIFNYSEAVRVMDKVVALLEPIKEQPDLILSSAYEKLGLFSLRNGKYAKSIKAYEQGIVVLQQLYPQGSKALSDNYNFLASAYLLNGAYEQAIYWQEKALDLVLQKTPIDSLSWASLQVNMGVNYRYLGKYEKSIQLQLNGLQFLERNQDDFRNKVEIAAAYNNLALTYIDNGNSDKALVFQIKANRAAAASYPADHPELAGMNNNLALAYHALDSCETALVYANKAVKRLNTTSSNQHPSLGIYYDNLAVIYSCLGQFDLALEANTKGMEILRIHFGENSPSVLTSKGILAEIYENNGDYELAYQTLKELFASRLKIFTPSHPSTLSVLNRLSVACSNLARINEQEGQLALAVEKEEEAILYLKQLINSRDSIVNADVAYLATEQLYLSGLYQQTENLSAAIQNAKACYDQRVELFDNPNASIAEASFFLASLYMQNKDLGKFLVFQEKTYDIWSVMRPSSDYSLTAVKNSLFLIYTTRGIESESTADFANAAQYYQKALGYVFSEVDNPEYKTQMIEGYDQVELTLKVGLCSYQADDYTTALRYFNKSYEDDYLPELSYLYLAGLSYAQLGRIEESRALFERSERLMPNSGVTYRNWAIFYTFIQDQENALSNLEKAYELGYKDVEWIEAEGRFDAIRKHQRYQVVIAKMRKNDR